MDEKSKELLSRFRHGDELAADEIHDRYLLRLLKLAQQRLSARMNQRVDAEDIVQSAYRSFFFRARDGQYALRRAGDLWRLLATITMNKLYGQVERHTAQRRSIKREARPRQNADSDDNDSAADIQPTPEEVVELTEQVQITMASLGDVDRRVLEMRLSGATIPHIAADINRSQRTVRRLLENARQQMMKRFARDDK